MDVETPGRREEHKRRTRVALARAAARLFEERGFEATTVRDIAVAAGVGERTFFRYFPSKEDLVLGQARDAIPILVAGLAARPITEPPLTALREALLDVLRETGTPPAILVTGGRGAKPAGQAEVAHRLLVDVEEAITEAFLDRAVAAGGERDDPLTQLRAAVLARAGVSALRGMMCVYPGAAEDRPPPDIGALLREAFAALDD